MKWITTIELENWAKSSNSKADFPWLVSRLIRATSEPSSINIPSGKDTYRGGWDGVTISSDKKEFVPSGVSLWEFGTTSNAEGKANKDYEKRTKDPLGYDPKDSTFIFVTPRIWESKEEWRKEKLLEGKWKEIKIIDGLDLEQWISLAPGVGKWLSSAIGAIRSESLIGIQEFWDEWSNGGRFPIPHGLLIAGNENGQNTVNEGIATGSKTIEISAPSKREAVAFLAAVIIAQDEPFREQSLSRSLIVENETDFRKMIDYRSPLVLVPLFDSNRGLFDRAAKKGHTVLFGVDPETSYSKTVDFTVEKPPREKFVTCLVDSGISKEEAERISKESNREIGILRRLLGFDSILPSWAAKDFVGKILPCIMAGSWDEGQTGDMEVLAGLAKTDYPSFVKNIVPFLNAVACPVQKVGTVYRVISMPDVWQWCSSSISDIDLQLFEEKAIDVLRYINPKFELAPEARFYASVEGKNSIYSKRIREGFCNFLTFLGMDSRGTLPLSKIPSMQLWVDYLVSRVLSGATKELWCSLADVLPLLAEASPKSFLEAVSSSLNSKEKAIIGLFEEEGGLISPHSNHSSLLWALESIAWLPDYLGQASLLLAKLAMLDPGGNLSNRPQNSLRLIFLPWNAQTFGTAEDRKDGINLLIKRTPEIAKKLLLQLLPKGHDTSWPGHKMKWRRFAFQSRDGVPYSELYDMHAWIVDRILSVWGLEAEMIAQLVPILDQVLPPVRATILGHIVNNRDELIGTNNLVWNALRIFLSNERSFGTRLPKNILDEIEDVYQKLEPSDLIEKNMWKMERFPALPEGIERIETPFEEQQRIIGELQLNAITELYQGLPWKEFLSATLASVEPYLLAFYSAKVIVQSEQIVEIAEGITSEYEASRNFAKEFVSQKFFQLGLEWLDELYSDLRSKGIADSVLAVLVSQLYQGSKFWTFVNAQTTEFQESYWLNMRPILFDCPLEEKIYAIEKLLERKRHHAVIEQVSMFHKEIPTDLIVLVLLRNATEESVESNSIRDYRITVLFQELDKRSDIQESDLANLEFLYLPFLASYGSHRKPNLIYKEVISNPQFFINILSWAFRPESEELGEKEKLESGLNDQQLHNRARLGWEILYHLDKAPGQTDGDLIDETILNAWVAGARELARDCDRSEIADAFVGQLLARFPENCDPWPPKPIAEVLDELDSEVVSRNFSCQVGNNRGVHSRSVFEGGDQERELAAKYRGYSKAYKSKYPTTAAILESIASSYDADAVREDKTAAIEDMEY